MIYKYNLYCQCHIMCLHNKSNINCTPTHFIVGNPTVNYDIDSVYIANSPLSTPSHLMQRST